MTAATPALTVYGVFTIGTDYYDTDPLLHTLYASQEQADAAAAFLRAQVEGEDSGFAGDPLYDQVEVQALTVR